MPLVDKVRVHASDGPTRGEFMVPAPEVFGGVEAECERLETAAQDDASAPPVPPPMPPPVPPPCGDVSHEPKLDANHDANHEPNHDANHDANHANYEAKADAEESAPPAPQNQLMLEIEWSNAFSWFRSRTVNNVKITVDGEEVV